MPFTEDPVAQRAAVDRLAAVEHDKSVLLATELRAAAHLGAVFGDEDPGVLLEVAGTARVGQGRAGTLLSRGQRMVELFPIALGLLETGVMRVGTVDILLFVSRNCAAEVQQRLDELLSEKICLLDAVDARKEIVRAIPQIEAELDPDAQRERHEQALADRRVWISPGQDGMAVVGAELGVLDAHRFGLDLEELVRAQKVLDDRNGLERTQAQRRADVFAKLPSLGLAIAEAATKGRLADLLPGALLSTVPVPRGSEENVDVAGTDELPLDFPPRTAPAAWQRDSEDLLRELLSLPVRGPVTMYVHTAMTTLLDLDQRSGWLEGHGSISAMHARILLPSADLQRVAVDARTGLPLGIDIPPNTPWFETCTWDFDADAVPDHGRAPDPPDASGSPPDQGDDPRDDDDDHGGGGRGGARGGGPEPGSDDPDALAAPGPSAPADPAPATARTQPAPSGPPSSEALRQRARVLNLLRPMYLDQRAEPQHDPSLALRTLARVRDVTCDGPGCPRAAASCELDHEDDYASGGLTAIWNLKHRTTRCHHRKHDDWTVQHDHTTGVSTWTSPAGSVYERQPFWPAPTRIPTGTRLTPPRLVLPLTGAATTSQAPDVRLWTGPLPRGVRHGRVLDPDPPPGSPTARALRAIADADASGAATRPAASWNGWDDGPPPF